MKPFVSVIVPVFNGALYIRECIKAILQQTYPRDRYEIIVVDGMSTDETIHIVQQLSQEIRIIKNELRHRGPAMNRGIENAQGDIIIRVDVRNIIPHTYLEGCVETLIATNADTIGGSITPLWTSDTQHAIGKAMSHPFGVGNALFRIGKSGYTDTAYLGAFRKELFSRVGYFEESSPLISEETDMNYRIRFLGGRVYCNSAIVVGYYPRETFRGLAQLYHRYGGARAMLVLKHKYFSSFRQVVPLLYVVLLGIAITGSFFHIYFFVAFLILFGTYLLGALIAAMHVSREEKLTYIPLIMYSFFCMHIPWALGFFRVFIMNGVLKRNINIEA
ncbi:MAG: glycosyltransferase family 2 protein [bacterium]|nr:glycosyltransferase family 2 protein [bacterium]